MRRDVVMSHDWDAATYDRVAAPQARWGAHVIRRLDPEGVGTVLDAGCGSGRVTEQLLEWLPEVRVVALDGSARMLEEARRRLARFGSRVAYVHADLCEALMLSYAAENQARMQAMIAAHCNLERTEAALTLQFQRVRQEDITDEILKIKGVAARDVSSFTTIDNVSVENGTLRVAPLMTAAPQNAKGIDALRKMLYENPLFINRIISSRAIRTRNFYINFLLIPG